MQIQVDQKFSWRSSRPIRPDPRPIPCPDPRPMRAIAQATHVPPQLADGAQHKREGSFAVRSFDGRLTERDSIGLVTWLCM